MKFYTIIFSFFLLAGFIGKVPILLATESIEMTSFTNHEKKFSLYVPKTWEIKAPFKELDLVVLAPQETPDDSFRENISIISGKIEIPLSLDHFFNTNLENLKHSLTDFLILQSGDDSFNGSSVKWVVYTHRINKTTLQVIQYFVIKKPFAYVITGSAEPSYFPIYQSAFKSIAKTFQILD